MLVNLDFALHAQDAQLKCHNAAHHLVLVNLAKAALLIGVCRVVVSYLVLKQTIFLVKCFDDFGINSAIYDEVILRRDACQVGVNTRRHVSVRAHKSDYSSRPCSRITPMRVGFVAVVKKKRLINQMK